MMRGQPRLAGLPGLNPGYFALVMATGIVCRAAYLDRFRLLGRTGQRCRAPTGHGSCGGRHAVSRGRGHRASGLCGAQGPRRGVLAGRPGALPGLATLVLAALLLFSAGPAGITSPYWVFMGATAISMLAGAQILRLPPDPLIAVTRPVIAGLSIAAWAFGTWLIPPLIAVGVWRHLVRRVRLRYEPGLWSIVFPLGMYGEASP